MLKYRESKGPSEVIATPVVFEDRVLVAIGQDPEHGTGAGSLNCFEVKYADAPGTTKSMHTALADLGLAHLWVVYPGEKRYDLTAKITVVPAREIPTLVAALKSGTVLRG